MSEITEPTSRKISIKRTYNGLPVWNEKDPQLLLWSENHVCGFGVRYESGVKTSMFSGLTREQENILLPLVTEVDPSNGDNYYMFSRARNEYYGKLRAYVPAGEGLTLEIGLSRSNDEPLSKDNVPLVPDHYAKWKAIFEKNPEIAKNRKEGSSQRHFRAFIEDGQVIKSEADKLQDARDEALEVYLPIKDSVKEMRRYITVLKGKHLHRSYTDEKALRRELLSYINEKPYDFISASKDNKLEYQYFLTLYLGYNIIEMRVGGIYWDRQSMTKLADSTREMLEWLADDRNSDTIAVMKRDLHEKINIEPEPKK